MASSVSLSVFVFIQSLPMDYNPQMMVFIIDQPAICFLRLRGFNMVGNKPVNLQPAFIDEPYCPFPNDFSGWDTDRTSGICSRELHRCRGISCGYSIYVNFHISSCRTEKHHFSMFIRFANNR